MLAHRWDRCHPFIGHEAPMIRRHVDRPNSGPFRLKGWAYQNKRAGPLAAYLSQAHLQAQPIQVTQNRAIKGPFYI